jgi:hypothetical protein
MPIPAARAAAAAAALLLVARIPSTHGGSSVVSNVAPRVDAATGAILDIHDGNTLRVGDTFYWYGAAYGGCSEMVSGCASVKVGACGFNLNHSVNLATSTDLVHWRLVGAVLPPEARPPGILFSPWVARSAATGLYVLWFNVLPVVNGSGDFQAAYYAVATARAPEGPFVLANANVTGVAYSELPDAPAVFVDDDGAGYLAFTHEGSHINSVKALAPDLLRPLPAVSAQIGPPNNEGVFMFKREGRYYVGFGSCCCFCAGGSTVDLYVAAAPLGPYAHLATVANASVWRAQTGAVWHTGADWVLYGDRWQSAPDRIKAHDFSYMAPLRFAPNGGVLPLPGWQDNVTIAF